MSPQQFVRAEGKPAAYAQPSLESAIAPILARFGVVRLLARPLGLIPKLPEGLQDAYLSRLARPSTLQATADETEALPSSGAQAGAITSLGNVPLIVLTGRLNTANPGWQGWQTGLLRLSTNSKHLFAEKSGHNIEIEEPEAAVAAITAMVHQVRGQ